MKKTRMSAMLLCIIMLLSSFSIFPAVVSAAAVGETVTAEELMDGLEAAPAAEINFDPGYSGFNSATAELAAEGNVTYLKQTAKNLDTESLKTDSGAEIVRSAGTLTKIKFRYAHNTANAGINDLIIFDGGVEGGYRARFSLITAGDGVQQFFVLQDLNGARNWGGHNLPSNGKLTPNTWHELAVKYDAEHNVAIWAQIGCTGDYVLLASFKLYNDAVSPSLRMGYNGSATGANSKFDVDYVKMYVPEGTIIEPDPGDEDEEDPNGLTQSELVGSLKTKHALEFEADMGAGSVSGGSYSVENGMLKLSNGADYGNKTFTYEVGDIAHFRFTKTSTGSDFPIFELNDGNYRMRFQPTPDSLHYTRALMDGDPDNYVSAGGGYSKWAVKTDPNVTYDYLIINTEDGYEFWRKTENKEKYSYIGITEGKHKWSETKLRILANGTSSVEVDFVRVYSENGSSDIPEPGDETLVSEAGKIWLWDDFNDPANSTAKLEDAQITDGTANIRPGDSIRDNGTTNFARITLDLSGCDLNGDWIMTMRMKLDATFWQANIGFGGTRSLLNLNQSNVKENGQVFNVSRELGVYYDYVYSVKNNTSASLYQRKVGTDEWQTVFTDITLNSWSSAKIEMNSNNTETSWDVDEIMVYSGALIEFDAEGMNTSSITAKGSVLQGVPGGESKRLSVIAAAYDKEHGYTGFIEEVVKKVAAYKETDLTTEFDLGALDMNENETAVMLWSSSATGIPIIDVIGYTPENKATGSPEKGQTAELIGTAHYNEVEIKGYAGSVGTVTASLIDSDGKLRAATQVDTNNFGMVDTKIAVDPALPSGEYTLYLQYGGEVHESKLQLYCSDILSGSAVDSAEHMTEFINNYGSEEEKAALADADFAAAAYERYTKLAVAGGENDLYAFQTALTKAIADEITERNLIKEMNEASADKRWSLIETILIGTYADYLGITQQDIAGIKNTKELYLRMTGIVYNNSGEILKKFEAAIAAQKEAEKDPGGGSSSSSGGGGGVTKSVGGSTPIAAPSPIGDNGSMENYNGVFNDLATVPWAEESIRKMSSLGFVNGDGSGSFSPDRAVSREEFLKMVMNAAGIKPDFGEALSFSDTDTGAWYYSYVAGAYKAGIVKGISDTRFGIGEQITRADMAVMLVRAMEAVGSGLPPVKAAFVFSDFSQIPDYAEESINKLCEAGLMQGTGSNSFAPMASATRAEAAVAVCRIYEYLNAAGSEV